MKSNECEEYFNLYQNCDKVHSYFKETLTLFDKKEPKRALIYAMVLVEYLKLKVEILPADSPLISIQDLIPPPNAIAESYKIAMNILKPANCSTMLVF
jgi:hypothetical protein